MMTNDTGQMTNSESLTELLAASSSVIRPSSQTENTFLILGELNLNFRIRLPWLAFLEASAREGYGIQECRPVLLGKRQHVCLLLVELSDAPEFLTDTSEHVASGNPAGVTHIDG
jgi:hypothetical protein